MTRRICLALACLFLVGGIILVGCSQTEEEAVSKATAGGPVPGVTDTEIVLGTHMPLSNSPAATYGVVADGMKAYFEYVNSQGGIYGRKIRFVVGDDHYAPADSVEVVRRLVEQDKVFAIVGGLGDPTHLAVMNYLEENGVPDLFLGGGVMRFTDPVVRTRFGMTTDYATESKIMTDYIKENFAGKTEGVLYQNDEAGRTGLEESEKLLEGSDVRIISRQSYDFGQFDLTSQMQRLRADNPDFVVLMANPGAAASAIKVARELLDWDVPFIASAVSAVEITLNLAGPQNAEGMISLTTGKMISEKNDPGVQKHIALMNQFAPGVEPSSLTEYGMSVAELVVQALKNAGPNLTRESVVEGAENIRDYCCISCLAPANLSPTDHRASEAMWFEQVKNGEWVRMTDVPVSYESTPGDVVACTGAGEPVYASE